MIAILMVQVAGNQVIDMVAMGDGLVSAARAMLVSLLMTVANVIGSADRGVRGGYFDHMLVHMVLVDCVQVSIVEVVGVAIVLHGRMSAVAAVLMRMLFMDRVSCCHYR